MIKQRYSRRESGITLIELMIVIVIVGIIAAIAYPSYFQYSLRTKRANAIADLLEMTHILEREFTATGRYDDAGNAGNLRAGVQMIDQSPQSGSAAYNISFVANSLNSTQFILQAAPTGSQTKDTDCGTIGVNAQGVRCILGGSKCDNGSAAAAAAVAECF